MVFWVLGYLVLFLLIEDPIHIIRFFTYSEFTRASLAVQPGVARSSILLSPPSHLCSNPPGYPYQMTCGPAVLTVLATTLLPTILSLSKSLSLSLSLQSSLSITSILSLSLQASVSLSLQASHSLQASLNLFKPLYLSLHLI